MLGENGSFRSSTNRGSSPIDVRNGLHRDEVERPVPEYRLDLLLGVEDLGANGRLGHGPTIAARCVRSGSNRIR